MKIDISSIDLENFTIKDGIFCGENAFLVNPNHIGAKFTQKNKIFRSSIWRKSDNELLSAGLSKFVNWGENPENFPVPVSLNKSSIINKIDGSLAVINYHNGMINVRTRGTFDARFLENGSEVDELIQKYPKVFDNELLKSGNYSIVGEWVSDKNIIILRYENCPDLYLLGIIKHEDYSYFFQKDVDRYASLWNIPRPERFDFSSIEDLISIIDKKTDIEGVCFYSNNDQEIHKIKSAKYLALHRLKSDLSSLDKVLDLYLAQGQPVYDEFCEYITKIFDFELTEFAKPHIKTVCAAKVKVDEILAKTKAFAEPLKSVSRKEAALAIIAEFKGYAKLCFMVLDGRSMSLIETKKLYEQVMEG